MYNRSLCNCELLSYWNWLTNIGLCSSWYERRTHWTKCLGSLERSMRGVEYTSQKTCTCNSSNMSIAGVEVNLSPHIKCFGHIIVLATQKGLKCAGVFGLRTDRVIFLMQLSCHCRFERETEVSWNPTPQTKTRHEHTLEQFVWHVAALFGAWAAECASPLDSKLRRGTSDMHTWIEIALWQILWYLQMSYHCPIKIMLYHGETCFTPYASHRMMCLTVPVSAQPFQNVLQVNSCVACMKFLKCV